MARRRDDLLIGPKEQAIAAIKAGKKEEAIRYVEELYKESQPLHDRYVEWIQFLVAFIAEKLGEDKVEEAFRGIVTEIYKDRWVSTWKERNAEDIARDFCRISKTHFSDFYIEEDDEKFIITVPFCGSGGKIQKEGKARGRRTKKAYPWSFGKSGVSYYCCHESVFNKMFIELGFQNMQFEHCDQFDDSGKPTGNPCRFLIYKKPPKP
jgi:hypothetical protein